MGLQKQNMRHFYAWLRFQCTQQKFQHDAPKYTKHTPSKYVTPVYGAKTQYSTQDETPTLMAKKCLKIQKSHRIRFVLRHGGEPTVLMSLNDITKEQTKATEKKQAAKNQ
jgi:hypothetical protein